MDILKNKFLNANYIIQIWNKTLRMKMECLTIFSFFSFKLITYQPW